MLIAANNMQPHSVIKCRWTRVTTETMKQLRKRLGKERERERQRDTERQADRHTTSHRQLTGFVL
jgi:hypothetical protein